MDEWKLFRQAMTNVDATLQCPVIFKANNEWSFVQDGKFDDFRFIQKVQDDDVNFLLAAYLIEGQVEKLVQDECSVCSDQSPMPEDAEEYQVHFAEHVHKYFETALIALRMDEALKVLNEKLKWNIKQHPFFGETQKLKAVALTPSMIQPAYCKDLAIIMRNTFDKLAL